MKIYKKFLIILVLMVGLFVFNNALGEDITVSISTNKSTVNIGETATISWTSDANSCYASNGTTGWPGAKKASGSFTTTALETAGVYLYTIVCGGPEVNLADPKFTDIAYTEDVRVTVVAQATAPINGACSKTRYSCITGTNETLSEDSTNFKWKCIGSNGGTTASCSEKKSVNTNTTDPSGTISATSCEITEGASTCDSKVTWSTSNLIYGAETEVTRNNPSGRSVSIQTSGTNVIDNIFYGETTFFIYHDEKEIAKSLPVTAECVEKTAWNDVNKKCESSDGNSKILPDLTAGPVALPEKATAGVAETYSALITNIGNTSTGKSFSYFFQKASNPNGTEAIDLVPSGTMNRLDSVGNKSAPATSPLISFNDTETIYLRVCADKTSSSDWGAIKESNEGNNCGAWVKITGGSTPTGSSECDEGDSNSDKDYGVCDLTIGSPTNNSVGVSFSTNKEATVLIDCTPSVNGKGNTQSTLTKVHNLTLTDLTPGTKYVCHIHTGAGAKITEGSDIGKDKNVYKTKDTFTFKTTGSSSGSGGIGDGGDGGNGGNGGNGGSGKGSTVNGVCSSRFTCSSGTSANKVESVISWTWKCLGLNGGATASCSEAKIIEKNGPVTIQTGNMLGKTSLADKKSFYLSYDNGANWQKTYSASIYKTEALGKLMNMRAANAIFDDENSTTKPAGFSADANTQEFIDNIPQYKANGVLAFTVGLQGGYPGYEGAVASAFTTNGTLKTAWLDRLEKVIKAADDNGRIVIVSLFYQRQIKVLADSTAIKNAVTQTTLWLKNKNFKNVIIEIANEYNHGGFAGTIVSDDIAQLVNLSKAQLTNEYKVSVTASATKAEKAIIAGADIVMIHGNNTTPEADGSLVAGLLDKVNVPVVVNEDDVPGRSTAYTNKTPYLTNDYLNQDKASATNIFNAGSSWGLHWWPYNQYVPFHWTPGTTANVDTLANYFKSSLEIIKNLVMATNNAPVCGNNICEINETSSSCSSDCNAGTNPSTTSKVLKFDFNSDGKIDDKDIKVISDLYGKTSEAFVYGKTPTTYNIGPMDSSCKNTDTENKVDELDLKVITDCSVDVNQTDLCCYETSSSTDQVPFSLNGNLPSIATDGTGNIHLIYIGKSSNGTFGIYYTKFSNNTWATPSLIPGTDKTDGNSRLLNALRYKPGLAIDVNNKLHLVYIYGDSTDARYNTIYYSSKENGSGNWSTPEIIHSGNDARNPEITTSSNKVWIATRLRDRSVTGGDKYNSVILYRKDIVTGQVKEVVVQPGDFMNYYPSVVSENNLSYMYTFSRGTEKTKACSYFKCEGLTCSGPTKLMDYCAEQGAGLALDNDNLYSAISYKGDMNIFKNTEKLLSFNGTNSLSTISLKKDKQNNFYLLVTDTKDAENDLSLDLKPADSNIQKYAILKKDSNGNLAIEKELTAVSSAPSNTQAGALTATTNNAMAVWLDLKDNYLHYKWLK